MSYYRYNGIKYGVCSHRPIWKSILVSLPIINLLYTKKIRVSLTCRSSRGEPITGIFCDFRIFRWQNRVKFRFMVHDTYTNVHIRVMDPKEAVVYARESVGDSHVYYINSQYFREIALTMKEEI